jgi:Family of unknown function (DUF6804)
MDRLQSEYGGEISSKEPFDSPSSFGAHVYRKHWWSKKVALIFELPNRTVEITLPATESSERVAKYICAELWHILILGVLQRWGSGILSPEDLLALEIPSPSLVRSGPTEKGQFAILLALWAERGDSASYERFRIAVENDNPILNALRDYGHDDNLIRLVALNAAHHYKEADRKWVENEGRAEALRVSELRVGKPPRRPFGKELGHDEQTGLRAYRRHWWNRRVTLVFELPDSEVAITPRLPPAYWGGKRLTRRSLSIGHVAGMLAAFGHEFQKGGSIDGALMRPFRYAFREAGYSDETFRQVALQMRERKTQAQAERKKQRERELSQVPTKRQESKPAPGRDWSLVVVQLVGVLIAISLFNFRPPEPRERVELGRLIVCGLSAYTAYVSGTSRRTGWAWLFGAFAVTYNPFVRVRLRNDDWVTLDLIVALVFLASAYRTVSARSAPRSNATSALGGDWLLVAVLLVLVVLFVFRLGLFAPRQIGIP